MNDYLLTGSTGFLGTVIRQRLSRHSVVCLGRSVADPDIRCDLGTTVPVLPAGIETVVHVAGKAHSVPRTAKEANEFLRVNATGTKNLTLALEASPPRHFVFISTVAVYGREEGVAISEDHPLNGSSPYALGKIEAESHLARWCKEAGVKLTVLRLPLIVGENPPGNLGAMVRWMRRGLYVGVGTGSARKSMVLASDVADFISRVSSVGGTYNLTDGVHPTMRQVEYVIAKTLGRTPPAHLPAGLLRVVATLGNWLGPDFPLTTEKLKKLEYSLTFSDEKARNLAGWKPHSVLASWPQPPGQ